MAKPDNPRSYEPPVRITPAIIAAVASISELIGRWSQAAGPGLSPQLRHDHRIRTIQASLAIEHNTLNVEQVTAVLKGKRVLGLPREIQEVRNAFAAYEQLGAWQPHSRAHLLAAHRLLMAGLVDGPGQFRRGGVGIYRGDALVHMAPPPRRVPTLIANLLSWLRKTDMHPLIASCVFHYEFEFIHPFVDGNGRLGRLWQTLILSRWQPMMAYLPVETVIRAQQKKYYKALAAADRAVDATLFVEFMLSALHAAMAEVVLAKGSEESTEKSSEKILALLRREPTLSARALAERLDITARAVEKQIARLRKGGRLVRVGPAKGGKWSVV